MNSNLSSSSWRNRFALFATPFAAALALSTFAPSAHAGNSCQFNGKTAQDGSWLWDSDKECYCDNGSWTSCNSTSTPTHSDDRNSCRDSCGDRAPGGCWCDDECESHHDCCSDYSDRCGDTDRCEWNGTWTDSGSRGRYDDNDCRCDSGHWSDCKPYDRCEWNGSYTNNGDRGRYGDDDCRCDSGHWSDCKPHYNRCEWNGSYTNNGDRGRYGDDDCRCDSGQWSDCRPHDRCEWNGNYTDSGDWGRNGSKSCYCEGGSWKNCVSLKKSCMDRCDDDKSSDGSCWCDDQCESHHDCCKDYQNYCGGSTNDGDSCTFNGHTVSHSEWYTDNGRSCRCDHGNWQECRDVN